MDKNDTHIKPELKNSGAKFKLMIRSVQVLTIGVFIYFAFLSFSLSAFQGITTQSHISKDSCPDCFDQELLFTRSLREADDELLSIPQHGFTKLNRASQDIIHDLIFEVKHKNIDILETLVNEISDPDNEKYGNFLSKSEVDNLVGNKEAISSMISYFKDLKVETSLDLDNDKLVELNSKVHAHTVQEQHFINLDTNLENKEKKKKIGKMKFKRGKKMKMMLKKRKADKKINLDKNNVNIKKIYSPSKLPSNTLTSTKYVPASIHPLESSASVANYGYGYGDYDIDILHNSKSLFKVLNEDTALSSGFVIVRAPIVAWEKVLNTKFYKFKGMASNKKPIEIHRASAYELPFEIRSHVRSVLNSIHFPVKIETYLATSENNSTLSEQRRLQGASKFSSQSIGYVNPDLINAYYNIDDNVGHVSTSQGIYAGLNERLSLRDLFTFQTRNNIPVQTISRAIGGNVMDNACSIGSCSESNLDIQYLMGVSRNTPTTFYYWSGNDPWLDWITTLASMADPPKVVSISYGSSEQSITSSYINSFNVQALKLSARGVTIIASSGNNGANSGSCGYTPQFPASSPYITAVGGTQGPEKGQPEVVCASVTGGTITSGGGFSNKFPAPSWQVNSIMGYFRNTPTQPVGGFNPNGRGYPDVSVLANSYEIITNGSPSYVSGTSAATPVVAGMVSLVNSQRVARGKSTLGWINPALYRYASFYIRDIVNGNNRCPINKQCCAQGYEASRGWDPVSGLGSIDYGKFRQVFANI